MPETDCQGRCTGCDKITKAIPAPVLRDTESTYPHDEQHPVFNFVPGANVMTSMTIILPGNGIRMSMAVIGILPILLVYPFLQKYLIRGVVMGAVKG
jgi:hypothetical protein